jgi:hypothetical protein
MPTRTVRWLVLAGAVASLGASYQTANFVVSAPTEEVARSVAREAEARRKELAVLWLGKELPDFAEPCPIRVTLDDDPPRGATSFAFDGGKVLSRDMHVEGPLERVKGGVLAHEITHVVFAERFGYPVPRWADEGGAVLAEDAAERRKHEAMVQKILDTPGRAIPLRRLFGLTKYPPDVAVLYAEGASVSRFLVETGGRAEFLDFVADGADGDWDKAVRRHYDWKDVDQLEGAWLEWRRAAAERGEGRDLP